MLLLTLGVGTWKVQHFLLDTGFLEISFDDTLGKQAVQGILTNTLMPDASGIVRLPPNLAKLTVDGEVCVTADASGATVILFRTWRGKGCNLRGRLYRSAPASGPPPTTIGALVPLPSAKPETQLLDLNVEEQIDANWYRVYWDAD